jgi:hypothetical protein
MDNNEVPTPNVSYCIEEDEVHYDGGDTIITVNLNIPSATTSDFIYKFTDVEECKSIRYDGETLELSISSEPMTSFTAGEHVIEYVFPRTVICPSIGWSNPYPFRTYIESVVIPEGIRRIESYPCQDKDGLCPSIGEMSYPLSIPTTLEYVGVSAICSGAGISQEDMARLDSLCPVAPTEYEPHPWKTACGK